jgi:tRNA (mo5U34)-methyltransferase
MDSVKRAEVLRRINSVSWYNRFELLPGIMTPGHVPLDHKIVFQHYGLPESLGGKQVLDIGTWDGAMAFACEARGAEVTALDIQDPDKTAFNTAKSVLGSNVRYVRGSVYDAPKLLDGPYDYVFCLGVLYHLKHPVLALERLYEMQPLGGRLIFESECLLSHLEDAQGQPIHADEARRLILSDVPLCAFYSGTYRGDDTNWFIPNPACLRGWFQATGYRVIREHLNDVPPHTRIGGVAEKVSVPPIEHRLVP